MKGYGNREVYEMKGMEEWALGVNRGITERTRRNTWRWYGQNERVDADIVLQKVCNSEILYTNERN